MLLLTNTAIWFWVGLTITIMLVVYSMITNISFMKYALFILTILPPNIDPFIKILTIAMTSQCVSLVVLCMQYGPIILAHANLIGSLCYASLVWYFVSAALVDSAAIAVTIEIVRNCLSLMTAQNGLPQTASRLTWIVFSEKFLIYLCHTVSTKIKSLGNTVSEVSKNSRNLSPGILFLWRSSQERFFKQKI